MEVVEDAESQYRHVRHESARSITEETRDLDEYLNRSSLVSMMAGGDGSSAESAEVGASASASQFERVEDLGMDEDDMERTASEDRMVNRKGRGEGCGFRV